MIRLLLASIVVTSLSTLVGCGASATPKTSAVPISSAPVERSRVATTPPPPPGSMDFSFDFQASEAPRAHEGMKAISCKANAVEKPKSGAVHAAY